MKAANPLATLLAATVANNGDRAELWQELITQFDAAAIDAALIQLEDQLLLQNDPAWLEMVAAAEDGLELPFYAAERDAADGLVDHDPAFVAALDTVSTVAQTEPVGSAWMQRLGFMWRQVHDSGQVVIRLLDEWLTMLPPPSLAPAVKGDATTDAAAELALSEDETGQYEIDAVLKSAENGRFSLFIRVLDPQQWPQATTAIVTVSHNAGSESQRTNLSGEVQFFKIEREQIAGLTITIASAAT